MLHVYIGRCGCCSLHRCAVNVFLAEDWRFFDFFLFCFVFVVVVVHKTRWWRGLTVSFPKSNYTARVYDSNCLSTVWENPCGYCLCHATILPCIFVRIYNGCGSHEYVFDYFVIASQISLDYSGVQSVLTSLKIIICFYSFRYDGLRSYFQIQYHPLQLFEMLRPALWCTNYTLTDAVREGFRDFFW